MLLKIGKLNFACLKKKLSVRGPFVYGTIIGTEVCYVDVMVKVPGFDLLEK